MSRIVASLAKTLLARANADSALAGASVLMAGGSVAFAGFMIAYGGNPPRINGMEYLAIFAKPHGVTQAEPLSSAKRDGARAEDTTRSSVDLAPTGTIRTETPAAPTRSASARIVAAEPGRVWLDIEGTIRLVEPGAVVPGVGRVAAIAERDGVWALVDEFGADLLTSSALSVPGGLPSSPPFARARIFGAPATPAQ